MQIDWFTFLAQIINFLILVALLQRFLYKPVIKAMDEREKRVASELEEARQKKVEAEEKERKLEDQLKDFESEKKQLMEDARQEVSERRSEWMEQLREEIRDIRKRWVEAVESEQESFLIQLKEKTGEQVIVLIKKVLADLSERNLQQQTVDSFFEKLKQLDEKEKFRLQETIEQLQTKKAEILSSFSLDAEQKHQLVDLLREASATDLECDFETSEKLGFGIEVRIGGWRLGWNLKSYLQELSGSMKHFLEEQSPVQESTSI